jgi:phosphatidylserine/phosphatidylglycerophosphate/cardiolipin synthase-like enzyme
VLEDPQILEHLQRALKRGVAVRAIVDRSKYNALKAELDNLAQYLTGSGGELHLSNPVFVRSFPKMIIVDSKTLVYGSACLDSTTFAQYRDFAQMTDDPDLLQNALQLFGNDWVNSSAPGNRVPPFSPTPPMYNDTVMVSPVNSSLRMTQLYQSARKSVMVYTELLGNEQLEGQLAAAALRGVSVLVITPKVVNGATPSEQLLQTASIAKLLAAGVEVRVSGPTESAAKPYMHARAAIIDDATAYLGSISLSPDSTAHNREFGLVFTDQFTVAKLRQVFGSDWQTLPSGTLAR